MAAALALSALSVCGCLFANEDVFEESASARMVNLIDDTRAALERHPEGWVLQYFCKEEVGGYNFVVTFDGTTARISCETAASDYSEECMWQIIKEDGAVLTFNTYSGLLQHFHEPSFSDVDGTGGDYEFRIQSVGEDDLITMIGKTGGATVRMFPLPDGFTSKSWLDSIAAIENKWNGDFYIYSSDYERIGGSTGHLGGKVLCITEGKNHTPASYTYKRSAVYLPDGFRLQNKLEIGGYYGQEFKLEGNEFVATDGNIRLSGNRLTPPTYEEMAGVWMLRYNNYFGKYLAKGVTVTTSRDGKTLYLKNLFSSKELDNVKLEYDNGRLRLYPQYLGEYGGYHVSGVLFDAKKSTVLWDKTTYTCGVYANEDGHQCFYFSDCSTAVGDYSADGLILYEFTTEEPSVNTRVNNLDILLEICLYR